MHSTITIMNAKGGVGKSTLTLTLAETLAACHGKRVLVVDSDAHASVSTMLMRPDWVQAIQTQGRTMVDYFIAVVLKNEFVNWTAFVSGGVSDVDDARTVDLMTGGGHLTLFEREVSKEGLESRLRHAVRSFLTEARNTYDFVFIDSAPGLSVLTECWLREVDFFVSPSKPDYISTHGLQFLGQFSQRDSDMGFAECLGVIISMKDINAFEDAQYERLVGILVALRARYPIRAVAGHEHVAPGRKKDPGSGFDWAALRAALRWQAARFPEAVR